MRQFEAIAWLAVLGMTLSPFVAVFVAASVGQMAIWAQKKHRACASALVRPR